VTDPAGVDEVEVVVAVAAGALSEFVLRAPGWLPTYSNQISGLILLRQGI
jgi:hypothetical protein